jgi:hypothetical protein
LLDNLTTESEYHNYDSYRPYLFIDAQKGELIFSEKSVNTHHDLSKLLSTGGRECRNGTLYIEPELGKDKFQAGLGFGYNKADIELSRDIENNIVSKVIVSSYALVGFIMPVYIEENNWMVWRNISQSERMCELPDGTVEKRAAESCLSSDGYIVN